MTKKKSPTWWRFIFKFYTAREALLCIENEALDLAVLDVMLPDMNGFQLCKKIREKHNYPVIMLTAKGEAVDKITGLSLGADDYMTKPFLPLELIARVKAQLRRYKRYNVHPDHEKKETDDHKNQRNDTGLHGGGTKSICHFSEKLCGNFRTDDRDKKYHAPS